MKLDKLVTIIVAALEDIKAHDIRVLNVAGITTLFDRMIIASADSSRQTVALANNVQGKVRAGGGAVFGMEGEETGEWVLVDLGDVLVHVMQTSTRIHYNLEDLWAGADTVDVKVKVKAKMKVKAKAEAKTKVKKVAGGAAKVKSKAAVKPRKTPLKPATTATRTKSKLPEPL